MAKKGQKQPEAVEEVQEQLSASAQWIERNANIITWVITGIIVVILGFILLNRYVFEPKSQEAGSENAKAVIYFDKGDFQTALNGYNADCIGFAQIADDYKHYKAGKLAALYAGICEYKLGEYEEAAEYLKRFDANDRNISPAAKMLLGDTYVEMEEYGKAAKAFEAAADSKNEIVAPMALKKAAFVYQELGKDKEAQKAFRQIKDKYPRSNEAQDIDKYIVQ